MHSATSRPSADATASSPSPSATTPSKRRHRVDSESQARWSPTSAAPDPKRARSGDHDPPAPAPAMPSAKSQGKRPVVIDLTSGPASHAAPAASAYAAGHRNPGAPTRRAAAFQPNAGARRLVIKNLRAPTPARAAGVEEYYARAWADLDAALTAVFAGRRPARPMELLYRAVEDLCRRGEAAELRLAELLRARFADHLGREVRSRIREDARGGGGAVAMLRAVLGHWKSWGAQLATVRSVFSYLDGGFLIASKTLPMINDMGIAQFMRMAFGDGDGADARTGADGPPPGAAALAGMCELVALDRAGDERFDPRLLKDAVAMLRVFNVYDKSFEPRFLEESLAFLERFAEERSASCSLKDYIAACEALLRREDHRCVAYNFDSTTKRQLLDAAHEILIEKYSAKLLDAGSVAKLLAENEVESVKALYELLHLSGIQKRLKHPWEEYIRRAGAAIVTDTARGGEMVVRLLELRRTLDTMIRDAFARDEDFTYGLREAFGHFINDKKIASAWNTGTSKVGEMVAKYIDMLLRGGLKTLPPALLSDAEDRAAAERGGVASTADEDAELDRQLDHALELFRFIEGKDVFEAFYKKDLARRLLMGRSASQDAERNMLTKLKSECGSSFTHNLEQMFKDQELAKDEMASYKMWRAGTGAAGAAAAAAARPGVDLNVSILSAAAWPTYPDVHVNLPPEVLEPIEQFDRYYKSKHTGRRLTWKHNLAHCMVRARFDRGGKELLVSAFQVVVLMLFNRAEEEAGGSKAAAAAALSCEQIGHATGLAGGELTRTLQSLACGRIRVLTKHPLGRDVAPTDTFTVNAALADPRVRIKINQIQLRETREENEETHQRVAADRQFETQAAIVRIMKSRKSMTHSQLVAEVINQTKSRGAVDAAEIKKNIEKLIEKEYLEREGGSYTYLA